MPPNPSVKHCAICGVEAKLHCGICDSQFYCSYDCQLWAWDYHKPVCKGGQTSRLPPPPTGRGQGVVRGLHFSTGGSEARFMWIRYEREMSGTVRLDLDSPLATSDYESGYMHFELGGVLALSDEDAILGYEAPAWFDITRDIVSQVDLGYTIRLISRDGFLDEPDVKVNTAIRALLRNPGVDTKDWHGPAVAVGIQTFTADGHPKTGHDLGREDARHLKNFFDSIGTLRDMVECVRINCDGDVEAGRPKFESIKLPANHAVFQQTAFPISSLIGLPLASARIPGNITMISQRSGYSPYANQAVTFLHTCCDPSHTEDVDQDNGEASFGRAPLTWDLPVGSCIIARLDKKPLLPDWVSALADFCQYHIIEFFQAQEESESLAEMKYGQALPKSYVLDQISKPMFEQYYHDWVKRQKDPESHSPSPFEARDRLEICLP